MDSVPAVIITFAVPAVTSLFYWLFKLVTRAEETKTEAAVDAFLEEKESRRSKSTPEPDGKGASEDGQGKVIENHDPVARQQQARLEQRLDALERRQVIADDRNFALLRTYHSQGLAQSKISFWFRRRFAPLG